MVLTTATAFWSYAHIDDEGSGGKIAHLYKRVEQSYQMHSGDALKSFFDRDDSDGIKWGEEWRLKIRDSIIGTTFFVPVISPSYLRSPICREEFNEFWNGAQSSGLTQLLLPVLWIDVAPRTAEEGAVWDIVSKIQYIDWRATWHEDAASAAFGARVHEMGRRMAEIALSVAESPTETPPAEPSDEPEPFVIDLMYLMNEADDRLEKFKQAVIATNQALGRVMEELQREPPPPNASAGQVQSYLNTVSRRLAGPANDFEASAKQWESETRALSELIITFAHTVIPGQSGANDLKIDELRQLPDIVHSKFGHYDKYRNTIAQFGRMTREMKGPIAALENGFDSLDAIREMMRSWAAALDPFEKQSSSDS